MRQPNFPAARLLIAHENLDRARELDAALRSVGYTRIEAATEPRRLVALHESYQPDLILAGAAPPDAPSPLHPCLRQLTAGPRGGAPALLVVIDRDEPAQKIHALSLPARDVLERPFHPMELLFRTETLLELAHLRSQVRVHKRDVEQQVRERTSELEEAQIEILERLALAAEYRDDTTGQHTQRVGQLSALLAHRMGLSGAEVTLIRRAAPLHDVGKIGLPDRILLKRGPLSPVQYEQMKAHTSIGARILSRSRYPVLQHAASVALTHHERWDGTGYPHGLERDAIPLLGRIVAVADVWDALTHVRPYKRAWTEEEALREVRGQAGLRFDPQVVDAFLELRDSYRLAEPAQSNAYPT